MQQERPDNTKPFEVIYDLREDRELLDRFQEIAPTPDIGPSVTFGTVGTDEWWANVARGAVEVREVSGTIAQHENDGGPMHDWPIVRVDGPEGRTSWTAWANFRNDFVGKQIHIQYAIVEVKKPFRPDLAKLRLPLRVTVYA